MSDFKTVSTKVSRLEFGLVEAYCKRKGISASALIRDLLLNEIEVPVPVNVAGNNKLIYNKERDSFSWFVELDSGELIEILKNVSPTFLNELNEIIASELKVRNNAILKKKSNSIAIPHKLIKRRKK